MTTTVTMTGIVNGVEMTVTLEGNGAEAHMLASEARDCFDRQACTEKPCTAKTLSRQEKITYLRKMLDEGYKPYYTMLSYDELTDRQLDVEMDIARNWDGDDKPASPTTKNQFTENDYYTQSYVFLREMIDAGYKPLYPQKNIVALTSSQLADELSHSRKWAADRQQANTAAADGVFDKPVIVSYEGNRIDCWSVSTIIQAVNTALSHGHVDLQLSR